MIYLVNCKYEHAGRFYHDSQTLDGKIKAGISCHKFWIQTEKHEHSDVSNTSVTIK